MNSRSVAVLVTIGLTVGACGSTATVVESSTAAMLEVVADDGGGSIIFYESLEDQVLDSDAVVSGRVMGIELDREEKDPGGAEEPLRWVHVLLVVSEVLHSSDNVVVEPGQVLRIEMPQHDLISLEDANKIIPGDNEGIHFLFNAASLLPRLGEDLPANPESIWIYQNGSSIVVNDDGSTAGGHEGIPGNNIDSYASFVDETRATAERIRGVERPNTPIGLTDHSNAVDVGAATEDED